MELYDAIITPDQPWGTDGTAKVEITRGALEITTTSRLEYKPRTHTHTTITKLEYNDGLIRINTTDMPHEPNEELVLPVEITTKRRISHDDWPLGGVLFV